MLFVVLRLKLIFKQIYKIVVNVFENSLNIPLFIFNDLLTTIFKAHKPLFVALTQIVSMFHFPLKQQWLLRKMISCLEIILLCYLLFQKFFLKCLFYQPIVMLDLGWYYWLENKQKL